MREAEEEIGLPPGLVEVIGPLSPLVSLHGIRVTPYVGLVPDYVEYVANDAEIAAVFSVPLDFFREDPREHTHRIDYQGRSWYVPSYRFGVYKIWGLTAIMIVELMNLLYDDANAAREMAAQLDEMNQDRKSIEQGMQREALAQLKDLTIDSMPFGGHGAFSAH